MTDMNDMMRQAHLEDLLARCLPYITSSIEDSDYVNRHAEHLANEIRKAVPWLKERDE